MHRILIATALLVSQLCAVPAMGAPATRRPDAPSCLQVEGVGPGASSSQPCVPKKPTDGTGIGPLSGIFFGDNPQDFIAAQTWLEKPIQIVGAHTGRAQWADWSGSIGWTIGQFASIKVPFAWSVPLFANGGTLADAGAGKYDSYYVAAAKLLAASYPNQKEIFVRSGEEFNADWMPWSGIGKEAAFAKAYRDFVNAFRSVSSRFRFEWNIANGQMKTNVEAAYPGDAYVDYIGMDFYWDIKWGMTDPVTAFNYYRDNKYGLQWLETFAAMHGKQTAYSEWGINSANGARYIDLAMQWFQSHDVAYQIYWDSNSSFKGKLTGGQYGAASDEFRKQFGAAAATSSTP